MQRLTALALILLFTFNFYLLLTGFQKGINSVGDFYSVVLAHNIVNVIAVILLLLFALYHATLGLKVVFDDYISCKCLRAIMICGMYFINLVTAFPLTISIIDYYAKNL